MARKVTKAAGNVFEDLGFKEEEAESLKIRSDLMIAITKEIDSRGLSQRQAATMFGVTQPRISDLVRGKIGLFSIDTLVDMLAKAGAKVRVEVRQRRRAA